MKIPFIAYVSYGKMDYVDYEVEVEISEEEYERLRKSVTEYSRMYDDPAVFDIYDKAYQAALELDANVLLEDRELLAEKLEWLLGITYEEALERDITEEELAQMLRDDGDRGVDYPDELRHF